MKSILICEGKTELILLSYYLGKVYGWESTEISKNFGKYDSRKKPRLKKERQQEQEWYILNEDMLSLFSAGGNNRIAKVFEDILKNQSFASDEPFERIVIMTDRDDERVEEELLKKIRQLCSEYSVTLHDALQNSQWCAASYENNGDERCMKILPIIIPFQETGTIETFLLKCVKEQEEELVNQCTGFVDGLCAIDSIKERYLKSRGVIPKAKFSTYFAIVSPNRTFAEGDRILKSIPWERYKETQETFDSLKDLQSEPT